MSYYEVVSYFLATYGASDIIVESYIDIMSFKQAPGQSPVGYTQTVQTRALRCWPIYDQYSLGEHSKKG